MSDSTALVPSAEEQDTNIQLIWNSRTNKYEAISLVTGMKVDTPSYLAPVSSANISYTPFMGDMIVSAIASGMTMAEIGRDPNYPPLGAINIWRAQNPEFKRRIELAYRGRAEAYHDQVIDLAKQAVNAHKDFVPGLKTAINAFQWAAERGDNSRYGAKQEKTGNAGGVTVIIDTGVKTQQPTSVSIEVDANGEFKGFINEQNDSIVRGSSDARPGREGRSDDISEGVTIELSRDRWRESSRSEGRETEENIESKESIAAETRF